MDKSDIAKNKFDNGFNCAQSVLTPFATQKNIDIGMALKLASGFGAGMGRTQGTCGALTGAYMVLGLKYGNHFPDDDANDKVSGLIQQLTKKFEAENEFTNCRDLLKVDLKTQDGQKLFSDNDLHDKVCSKCVKSAIKILEELID